jgi:hypothetical protein
MRIINSQGVGILRLNTNNNDFGLTARSGLMELGLYRGAIIRSHSRQRL